MNSPPACAAALERPPISFATCPRKRSALRRRRRNASKKSSHCCWLRGIMPPSGRSSDAASPGRKWRAPARVVSRS
eukprot:979686-Pyramimonas_sp.AAC.1